MTSKNSKQIVIISGPTASGKSNLGISIAKKYNGYIINADCRQIYKGFQTLCASPSAHDQEKVQHELYNCIDLKEEIDIQKWQKLVFLTIHKNNDKMPILIGGSGFYLKSLIHGFYDIPKIDDSIKSKIAKIKNQSLWNIFCKYELNTMDNKIHKNDYYRLKRAIEIKLQTGKNMSEFKIIKPYQIANYKLIHIMVLPDKTSTNNLIEKRFYKMITNGAIKEVEKNKSVKISQSAKTIIGITEIENFLNKTITKSEMINAYIVKCKQYAKRQRTFLQNQFEPNFYVKSVFDENYNTTSLQSFLDKEIL